MICCCISFSSLGQDIKNKNNSSANKNPKNGIIRCATTENENRLRLKNPNRLTKNQFENWLSPIIESQKQIKLTHKTESTIYTIPVVIHIIHNGDAVNTISSHTSENISDAQAASQITVLNQDFRRILGTPGYGTTGYNRGVDCQINFVLAKQDPFGVATTGIEHINMGKDEWSDEEADGLLKAETQWDPTKYLNIWTVKFSAETDLLGYAQFPSNSSLGGIDPIGGDANTDGIVINYYAFGTDSENNGSFELRENFDLGRTSTHEIGHYLGLRHIWGDDEKCTGNNDTSGDFVTDTPDSNTENRNCIAKVRCTGLDMIENYMDYTDDACMDTFTNGQKTRMTAVITNSPRRRELSSSNVTTPGTTKTVDAALKNIFFSNSVCNSSFTPSINIENKGTNVLTTATIRYSVDNSNPVDYVWNGNLAQNSAGLVSLPEIVTASGSRLFNATIISVNNSPDLNNVNNTTSKNINIPPINQQSGDSTPKVTLTLQCDRDGSETTWTLKNRIGTTLYQGGPYADASSSTNLNAPITQVFNLQNGECYTFTINDSYGDGINTNGGVGSYSLRDENNSVFASGGIFLFNETKGFTFGSLGTDSFETSKDIYIYPNPAKEIININIPSIYGLPTSYSVVDNLGKTIITKKVKNLEDLSLNTSLLSNGVYYITIAKGNEKKTIQFLKE
jgi:hypothetical protein